MGIACRIHKNKISGDIIGVEALNGKNSILYEKALDYTGDINEALKLYVVGNSDNFKEYNSDEFGNDTFIKDINGEPILKEVLNYLKTTENNKVSTDNKIHFDNFKESVDIDDNVLKQILFDTFTDEFGNFNIDENKIRISKLYVILYDTQFIFF